MNKNCSIVVVFFKRNIRCESTYIGKETHQVYKPGSVMGFVLPTFQHDAVIIFWARFGRFQSLITRLVDSFENLLASQGCPWLKSVTEHLPKSDAECPNIGRRGEFQIVDALRCTPRDRKFEIDIEIGLVVIFPNSKGAREAEIGNLNFVLAKY